MECIEQLEESQPRVYLAVLDVLLSSRLGASAPAHRLSVEKLVIQYGVHPVVAAFDYALAVTRVADDKRMCVLIALQFVTVVYGCPRIADYTVRLQPLISPERLELAIESFSMGVLSSVHANRADLAVEALVGHFEWLKKHGCHDAGPLNISAAYTCEQFGRYDLALQFSFLGYTGAFHAEDETTINLANFFVLSTSRLATGNTVSLRSMYDNAIEKLETGRLDLGVHLNFLLPVYAASHEVLSSSPDFNRVENLLSLASEINNGVDDNCRLTWEVVQGCQQLKKGHRTRAIESLEHSEACQVRVDGAVEPLRQLLRSELRLRTAPKSLLWTPASTCAWKDLQRCADYQQNLKQNCRLDA